jgi:hypothetical protein
MRLGVDLLPGLIRNGHLPKTAKGTKLDKSWLTTSPRLKRTLAAVSSKPFRATVRAGGLRDEAVVGSLGCWWGARKLKCKRLAFPVDL